MFKSIRVGNFKAFGETQKIPLKPITLIFGPNSSGKSSIIHSLAFMHHAIETEDFDVRHTIKGGDSIDLGGFEQAVHKHHSNKRIEWGIEIPNEILNKEEFHIDDENQLGLWSSPKELFDEKTSIRISLTIGTQIDDQDRSKQGARPKVINYEIVSGGLKFLKMSLRPDDNYRIDIINNGSELTKRVINFLKESSGNSEKENFTLNLDSLVPDIEVKSAVFPYSIKRTDSALSGFDSNQKRFVKFLSVFIEFLYEYIKEELDDLEYLGPLRSYPPRIIELAEDNDPNFRAGGGFAWNIILKDAEVREKINKWLGSEENLQTPYNLKIKYFHTIDGLDKYYSKNIIEILERGLIEEHEVYPDVWSEAEGALSDIKEFEDKIAERKELVLTDLSTQTEVSHRDIGIGISQVLPVLVSALGNRNKTIAIEQPEIHLHPAIQAELGDVFIEGVLEYDNSFILETHSEHLILRLLRRIRESNESDALQPTKIDPDDIMILYVAPHKKGSRIFEIPVDDEGEFERPWPNGFFAERSKELFG